MRSTTPISRTSPTFIEKLLNLLEDPQCQPFIQWIESNNGFNIVNVSGFTQNVLPVYFKHQNYSSFVRQLNMYGFGKVRGREGENVYEHRNFRRGSKACVKKIQRKINTQGGEKCNQIVLYNRPSTVSLIKGKQGQIQRLKEKQIQLEKKCLSLLQRNKSLLQENQQIIQAIRQQQTKKKHLIEQIFNIISTTKPLPQLLPQLHSHSHYPTRSHQFPLPTHTNPHQPHYTHDPHYPEQQLLFPKHKQQEEEPLHINNLDNEKGYLTLDDFINIDDGDLGEGFDV